MLRAVQVVVDEGLARPLLIGRPDVIAMRIETFGLRLKLGRDCEVRQLLTIRATATLADDYYQLQAPTASRARWREPRCAAARTLIGRDAGAPRRRRRDAVRHGRHLRRPPAPCARRHRPARRASQTLAAMNMLMLPERQLFICDTYVNHDPSAEQIAEMTLLAAEEVRRFGVTPSVALLSHSSFGSSDAPSAGKMREALALIRGARSGAGGRRRDARRRRAVEADPRPGVIPDSRLRAPKPTCWSCPTSMPPTSPTTCCEGRGRQRHHGRRASCSAPPGRCTS